MNNKTKALFGSLVAAFLCLGATTITYQLPSFSTTEFGLASDNTLHIASGATLTNAILTNPTVTTPALGAATATSLVATNSVSTGTLTVTTNSTIAGSLNVTGTITNASLTASLPVFTAADKTYVSKTVANTLLALGIQKGTATTANDGTVTNVFGTAYSVAPQVVFSAVGVTTSSTNAITVTPTTTQVIFNIGVQNKVINWISIGTP